MTSSTWIPGATGQTAGKSSPFFVDTMFSGCCNMSCRSLTRTEKQHTEILPMLKTSAIALALALAILAVNPAPAFAQNCGRWISCPPESEIGKNARSWVYGNTRDVEPWVPMKKKVRTRKRQQPAPDSSNSAIDAPGASPGVESASPVQSPVELFVAPSNITSGSGGLSFSPPEEAAVRAYLGELDKEREPKNLLDISAAEQPFKLPNSAP